MLSRVSGSNERSTNNDWKIFNGQGKLNVKEFICVAKQEVAEKLKN